MTRPGLKVALVMAGVPYRVAADRANKHLPPGCRITEVSISRWVMGRTNPSEKQAAALAAVLGRPVAELFKVQEAPE